MRRREAVGLILGLIILAVLIGWSARETQILIEEQNQILANQERLLEETRAEVCGSWLATYIVVNQGIAPKLPPKQARDLRQRIAADFKARCDGYVQAFP